MRIECKFSLVVDTICTLFKLANQARMLLPTDVNGNLIASEDSPSVAMITKLEKLARMWADFLPRDVKENILNDYDRRINA